LSGGGLSESFLLTSPSVLCSAVSTGGLTLEAF
jgi:hypothetical protein